jgi:hypothetical protein
MIVIITTATATATTPNPSPLLPRTNRYANGGNVFACELPYHVVVSAACGNAADLQQLNVRCA